MVEKPGQTHRLPRNGNDTGIQPGDVEQSIQKGAEVADNGFCLARQIAGIAGLDSAAVTQRRERGDQAAKAKSC